MQPSSGAVSHISSPPSLVIFSGQYIARTSADILLGLIPQFYTIFASRVMENVPLSDRRLTDKNPEALYHVYDEKPSPCWWTSITSYK
jgi:hypothetical protein